MADGVSAVGELFFCFVWGGGVEGGTIVLVQGVPESIPKGQSVKPYTTCLSLATMAQLPFFDIKIPLICHDDTL